jgi:hypothetical protein
LIRFRASNSLASPDETIAAETALVRKSAVTAMRVSRCMNVLTAYAQAELVAERYGGHRAEFK